VVGGWNACTTDIEATQTEAETETDFETAME
jgi:hypothetical protein